MKTNLLHLKPILAWLNSPFVLIILTFCLVALSADFNPGYGPFTGPFIKILAAVLLACTIWRFIVAVKRTWFNKPAEPKKPGTGYGPGEGWHTEGIMPEDNLAEHAERPYNGY